MRRPRTADRLTRAPRAVVLYRDSPLRRRGLADPCSLERYALYGLDGLEAAGVETTHNLAPGSTPGVIDRRLGRLLDRRVRRRGGYGGDFPSVLAMRGPIGEADVVVSTVDTVGIPLALLRRGRLVASTPMVYVSIGLLHRVRGLADERSIEELRSAVAAARLVIAYGHAEAKELDAWLGPSAEVRFVPFGVDVDAFAPSQHPPVADVASVGTDPYRDWRLLIDVARRLSGACFRVVASESAREQLAGSPANVSAEYGRPLAEVRDRLAHARVVALPVVDNEYSGATTTLLQAMACARPVVVSRTRAIADGYGLVDGGNCVLVPPGDADAMERAVRMLLDDPARADALGRSARAHVVAELGWERYGAAITSAVLETARA